MSASLVGSEMCIRDRRPAAQVRMRNVHGTKHTAQRRSPDACVQCKPVKCCLLYTSDAADDM
eukprot:9408877-Alexandrium_andersonii.AAC.1